MRLSDPFREFDWLIEQLGSSVGLRTGMMPMDALRKGEEFVLRFDLPGVHPENISLEVENHVLTITAERVREDVDEAVWITQERPQGRHSRQVRLGPSLDTGAITAAYDMGVLTVTIPVREEAKPKQIGITVGQTPGSRVLEASSRS